MIGLSTYPLNLGAVCRIQSNLDLRQDSMLFLPGICPGGSLGKLSRTDVSLPEFHLLPHPQNILSPPQWLGISFHLSGIGHLLPCSWHPSLRLSPFASLNSTGSELIPMWLTKEEIKSCGHYGKPRSQHWSGPNLGPEPSLQTLAQWSFADLWFILRILENCIFCITLPCICSPANLTIPEEGILTLVPFHFSFTVVQSRACTSLGAQK